MNLQDFIKRTFIIDPAKSIRLAEVLGAYRAAGGVTTRSSFIAELGKIGYSVALDSSNAVNILGIAKPKAALKVVDGRIARRGK